MTPNPSNPTSNTGPGSGGPRRPDPLSRALQQWRVESTLPPGFQDAVWQRVDRLRSDFESPAPATSLFDYLRKWLAGLVARPALATAYLAVLVSFGATAGWSLAQREVGRVRTELAQRYVQTLDPYAARP